MIRHEMPPLAVYRSLSDRSGDGYRPKYGDFVVWSGFITTWHGVVTNFNEATDEIHIIFSTMPYMLFTMDDVEQAKETKVFRLTVIKAATHGTWAFQQHDHNQNTNIWYL